MTRLRLRHTRLVLRDAPARPAAPIARASLGVWMALATLVPALALVGCGDDMAPPGPGTRYDGGGRTDAGHGDAAMDGASDDGASDDGASDDGTVDPASCTHPLRPVTTIEAPMPASDPNAGELLTTDRVRVACRVSQAEGAGALPVDAESVEIALVENDVVVAAPPVTRMGANLFEANFEIASLPNGALVFRCSATDTSAVPLCATTSLGTLNDQGPAIEVVSPTPPSVHADRMTLRYRVRPAPVAEGDTEATVVRHTLTVAGRSITNPTMVSDGEYVVDIDFRVPPFDDLTDGTYEIGIVAVNARTPDASDRAHVQPFVLDRVGPAATITTPVEGQLVGGLFRVVATIVDPSGVDASSVVLRVGMMELAMTPTGNVNEYARSFDASRFPSTVVELTLNVTARDIVGNLRTASRIVKLDSVPPFVALDPPMIREGRLRSGLLECSYLFDPVGYDSVDDGEIVGTAAEFRARVEDVGNVPFGSNGSAVFIGGIDEAKVDLYISDDVSIPLLVDTNADGVCDEVNPVVVPAPGNMNAAVVQQLVGVRPTGSAIFPARPEDVESDGLPADAYQGIYGGCTNASSTNEPRVLCPETSPLTRVIPVSYNTRGATIFARGPLTTLTCNGDAYDFQSSANEGAACVAVRVEDTLGNVGVSAPLRVCFTDGMGANPCPGNVGASIPEGMRASCTDGCVAPRSFVDVPGAQLVVPR